MLKVLIALCLIGVTINCFKSDETRVFLNSIKDEHHEKVFSLHLAGKDLIVKIQPTNSNGNSRLLSTQSSGTSKVQSRNCYYEGQIVDHPESFVHLYACEFLRGLIKVDDKTSYTLDKKDKTNPTWNDYFVRKQSNKKQKNDAISIDEFKSTRKVDMPVDSEEVIKKMLTNPKGQEFRVEKIKNTQGDRSYTFKMELIVDTFYFENVAGKNRRFVVDTISDLVEIVDRPFATERISVTVSQLIINDLYDTVIISSQATPEYILQELFYYRTYMLGNSLNFDVTYLLSGYPPLSISGGGTFTRSAFSNTVCKSNGVGVQLNFIEDNYQEAQRLFFLMYVGFGGSSDTASCRCDAPGGCVADLNLDPTKLKKYGNVGLSSCTYDDFRRYAQGNLCLNIRFLFAIIPTNPTCGNWLQEVGEECDCGRQENCEGLGLNKYCNYKTCKMASKQYECLEGNCCTPDNKFMPLNTPCSIVTHSICDLFEGCSGTHGFCAPDSWALDGTPCGSDGTLTCSFGSCVDNYGTKRAFARRCAIKCSNHGICNNRWNCHCEPGYICLNCVPLPGSPGGSIDSGAKCLSDRDEQSLLLNDLVAAIIIILFLNILPIVSTISFLVYSYVTSQGMVPSQYGLYSIADF